MNQTELEQALQPYPDMLTVAEVATLLRVHPRSVQRWARAGRFASVRAGRSYRIPRAEVIRWLRQASIPVAAAGDDATGKE
ncbi:MAG: helix-turn-helix domain-containing protein [Chloroflexaceae bacterium]